MLFDRVKQVTGKETVTEIWPTLRWSSTAARSSTRTATCSAGRSATTGEVLEVYPCSEGFVATEDPRYRLLRIVPDHDVFFEFVPVEEFEGQAEVGRPTRHTLATVEIGVQYAVVDDDLRRLVERTSSATRWRSSAATRR